MAMVADGARAAGYEDGATGQRTGAKVVGAGDRQAPVRGERRNSQTRTQVERGVVGKGPAWVAGKTTHSWAVPRAASRAMHRDEISSHGAHA